MKILVVPCNQNNAKTYPYWDRLVKLLEKHEVQIIDKKVSNKELIDSINNCDTYITIDSFVPHFCAYHKLKQGIVIFGKSDPAIFGYKHNINLLKDRKYLRYEQFKWWLNEPINNEVFVSPEEVLDVINKQ